MVNFKVTALVAGLSCAALLAGCEGAQSEKDMIMEAQYCLDKANSGTADSCISGIASLTSENAYAIRCAAGFLKSGVTTPENLAEAFTAIQDNGNTATMLSILNFDGDTTLADWTTEQCTKSGSAGLALMGSMAKSATALASAASDFGSCTLNGSTYTCDEAAMSDLIADIETALLAGDLNSPTPEFQQAFDTVEAVIQSVQSVYSISCGTAGSNSDICSPINKALDQAGMTPAQLASLTDADIKTLGEKLLAQWK
ncbi:hypothetical protein [Bdellovibrio sp. HCB274]|uniref:hypothetical protein n=1 Tax=Bdellovibrio sp. HCB274 TaxID=3394361 RepID=UPI0039B3C620